MGEAAARKPKFSPLSKVADSRAPIVYGIVQPGPDLPDGVAFVQSRDVGGQLSLNALNRTSAEIAGQYRRSRISTGDILFSLRGNIGQSSLVPPELEGANIARGVARIRVTEENDAEYIRYVLQGPALQKLIARNANGSTFREISIDELRKLPIPAVPLPEQRKIAEILLTWDEAIEKLEALRAAKGSRLDGLRAGLLFGGLRLNGHHRNWVTRHLSEVTDEMTARNGKMRLGRDAVMGVTNTQGIVPMREQTIAEDIGRYKRLPPRAFAYNPMRINVGSIAMNDGPDEVLVSPDYVVFGCNPEGLDPDYLDHLRKTRWWGHYINSGGSGSVRMRTYYDDLAAMKLPLPELDEQREIVRVLNAARDEVTKTAKQIDLLTRQKRGLMQKLLTGQWRVAIDEPATREAMA